MIEDKKLGMKLAENVEEAAWERIKEKAKEEIKQMQRAIEINKVIAALAERKKKEATR